MTEVTPLDRAHAEMVAAGEEDSARMVFFGQLAAAELFLLLKGEPTGDTVEPELAEVAGQSFALVFDLEERLAEAAGGEASYAALSGRVIAGLLASEGIGLVLNPGVAPSEALFPAEVLRWLTETAANAPEEAEAQLEELLPPSGVPEAVIVALDRTLATAAGRARSAYLVTGAYAGGARNALLAFIDPAPGAEGALARIVGEALTFSGIEAGALDVMFFPASAPVAVRLSKVGLRFDLPEAEAEGPAAPGTDPEKPPKLR